jgi:hypothetical protein
MASDNAEMKIRRDDTFRSLYANNIGFLATPWDFRLIFGLQEQNEKGELYVQQHTAITVSWGEAKLIAFLMNLHIRAFEVANGPLKLPKEGIPEVPPIPDELKEDKTVQEQYRTMLKMRDDLLKG